MRPIVVTVSALALLSIGFGAGYWYRSVHGPPAEMESYALSNILEDVAYVYFLSKGDAANIRELIDVNLHRHLSTVRERQRATNDADFTASKIRTLNALANVWEQRPPFTSEQWRENDTNRPWWGEWQEVRAKNAELLRWAKEQCAATPSLQCRFSSLAVEAPVNQK